MSQPANPDAPRWTVLLAFATVYLVWGAAFLASRTAVLVIPPFALMGFRFTLAGLFMYQWARWRGAPRPTPANWRAAAIVGLGLMVGGQGLGAWALQYVFSGLAAVLVGTMPMWMVLLHWLFFGGPRPSLWVVLGLAMGLAGVALIVGPNRTVVGSAGQPLFITIGVGILLSGAVTWAAGSLYARNAPLPDSQRQALGMEMLSAGIVLLALAIFFGDFTRLDFNAITLRAAGAVAFLIVFASIVAFVAYFHLLRVTTPALASTYAYVNPVIAIFLGWALGDEPLTPRIIVACAIVVTGVAIITFQQAGRANRPGGPSV